MKLGVIVHCPSPHQKVLLDHLARVDDTDVVVAYAYGGSPNRNWGTPMAEGRTVMVPAVSGLGAGRRLDAWVADLDRDVWVLGSAFTYSRTQALAASLHRSGKPWAYLGEPPRPRGGIHALVRDWLLRRVLSRCDGVIATGVESARRYRRLLGDARPATSVSYYIPLDGWSDLPLARTPADGEPIRFLALSQLIERKGLDVLIEACGLLPRGGWSVDIYGEGPERQALQRMIDARGLPVTLHRPLPFATRMTAFPGHHGFVFPSRWDGWGMALVEALAAGLPVIATDTVMSAHDFLADGRAGWITRCDPPSIAAAMRRLLDDPAAIPQRSRAARDAVEGFRPEVGAAEFVRFCRYMANSPTADFDQ
jgi:glycosyltransferase involved in cell wall biosynthesis